MCFLFSHFLPSSSLSRAHGQTDNFHCSPIHSQGATYIRHLWTTNMKIPPNPRWGRNCLQMGCSRMRRGKQHLLLDACLCMKWSLLDGFPCTEFFSLSTFDYLTALLKITLERWKEGNSEVPYSVCFSPAGPLSVQPHCSQALEGDMG